MNWGSLAFYRLPAECGVASWYLPWIQTPKIRCKYFDPASYLAGAVFCVWIKTTTHAPEFQFSLPLSASCFFVGPLQHIRIGLNSIASQTQRQAWPDCHFRPTSKLYSYFVHFFLEPPEYVRRPRLEVRARGTVEEFCAKTFNRKSRNQQPEEKFIKRPPYFRDKFREMRNLISRHWNLFLSTKETIVYKNM